MKYMCLIYYDEKKLEAMAKTDFDKLMEEGREFYEAHQKSGHAIFGSALESIQASATIRFNGRQTNVTDGPFIETKEQLGGFVLIEARDLEEAIQIAEKIPPGRLGSIEIRPLKS